MIECVSEWADRGFRTSCPQKDKRAGLTGLRSFEVVLEQRTFVPVFIVHTAEKWAEVSKILFITAIESSKFLVTEPYLEIAKGSSFISYLIP